MSSDNISAVVAAALLNAACPIDLNFYAIGPCTIQYEGRMEHQDVMYFEHLYPQLEFFKHSPSNLESLSAEVVVKMCLN